jgi:predicted NBD/HSP70 family sugar kinase
MRSCFAGIDVGATTTKIGLYEDFSSEPIATTEFPTDHDFESGISAATNALHLLAYTRAATITGVGAVVAGLFDPEGAALWNAGRLTGWIGRPVRDRLQQAFPGSVVATGNDAQGQALAEARAAWKLQGLDFLFISLGTGVGIARIKWIDDKPVAIPSEGAHIQVDYSAEDNMLELCGCGANTCLESRLGGNAIEQRFDGRMPSQLKDEEWIGAIIPWFARGVEILLAVHPVQHIVIGGGGALRTPKVAQWLREYWDEQGWRHILPQAPAIHLTQVGQVGASRAGLMLLAATDQGTVPA